MKRTSMIYTLMLSAALGLTACAGADQRLKAEDSPRQSFSSGEVEKYNLYYDLTRLSDYLRRVAPPHKADKCNIHQSEMDYNNMKVNLELSDCFCSLPESLLKSNLTIKGKNFSIAYHRFNEGDFIYESSQGINRQEAEEKVQDLAVVLLAHQQNKGARQLLGADE